MDECDSIEQAAWYSVKGGDNGPIAASFDPEIVANDDFVCIAMIATQNPQNDLFKDHILRLTENLFNRLAYVNDERVSSLAETIKGSLSTVLVFDLISIVISYWPGRPICFPAFYTSLCDISVRDGHDEEDGPHDVISIYPVPRGSIALSPSEAQSACSRLRLKAETDEDDEVYYSVNGPPFVWSDEARFDTHPTSSHRRIVYYSFTELGTEQLSLSGGPNLTRPPRLEMPNGPLQQWRSRLDSLR